MTVLATGGDGQLGRALARRGAVVRSRVALDITDAAAVARALDEVRPELVINAAAFTAVDRAESEEAAAFAVNEGGARNMAAACAARDIRFVHVSTDYVFDGTKPGPYVETDATGPTGAYGRSKLAGEKAVLAAHPDAVVVRTSWVFAAEGQNFVRTMLRLGASGMPLRVVADQRGCPTGANDLARGVLALGSAAGGIYHYVGDGPTTWYDFALTIFEEAALSPSVTAVTTAEYPTPARRPKNSVLDTSKVRALGVIPGSWRDELRSFLWT